MRDDLDCRPYAPPVPADVDPVTGEPLTIMACVAAAHRAAEAWRFMMDTRQPFDATLRAAADMARAIDAVARAVADEVAEGDGQTDVRFICHRG